MIKEIVNRFHLWNHVAFGEVAEKAGGRTFFFGVGGRARVPLGFYENGYYNGIRYIVYWEGEKKLKARKLLKDAYRDSIIYRLDCVFVRRLYLEILRMMDNHFWYQEEPNTGKPHMAMLMRLFFND